MPNTDQLFTDQCDEYGPLGNDTGADVLAHYRKWRQRRREPQDFLPYIFRALEVPDRGWNEVEAGLLIMQLKQSSESQYEWFTRDDAIIALAFAQWSVDGELL